MNKIDMIACALLGVSVVAGLFRGLIAQVLSLAGWVCAYFASQWLAPQLSPYLPVGTLGPGATMAASMALCFIALIVAWGLLARLLVQWVRSTGMSGPDRLLGAGFGLFRGVFVLAVLVTLVQLTPLAQTPPWQSSQAVAGVRGVLRGLSPMLPPAVARAADLHQP